MRLDSIESDVVHSGSVSPPAAALLTMDSMNGKKAFFETMRTKYANNRIEPAEMEKKIEQLWKGLSQTQKEQFILKSAKENKIPQKSPEKKPFSRGIEPIQPRRIPELRRTDNIKAIAKVLDLSSDSRKPSRYADTIKNRMQAYTFEANIASRKSPPRRTAAHFISSAQQLRLAADSAKSQLEVKKPESGNAETPSGAAKPTRTVPSSKIILRTPFTAEKREKIAQSTNRTSPLIPKPSSLQKPESERPVVPQTRQLPRIIKRRPAVPQQRPAPPRPQIPYKEACQQYYEALSQATLMYSVDNSCLSTVAPIVEGFQITREYTLLDRL